MTEPEAVIALAEEDGARSQSKRRKKQSDDAAEAIRDIGDLWHDEDLEPWLTFTRDGHREHWPLRSKAVRSLISLTYYQQTDTTRGRRRDKMRSRGWRDPPSSRANSTPFTRESPRSTM